MKPGPELDRYFAEIAGIRTEYDSEEGRYMTYTDSPFGEILTPFEPSTSWKGMRLVVEEMQRRKYAWRIEGLRAAFFDPYAGSPADDGTMVYAEALGETTPHAVVLAAIEALQGE